jgi:hypothetical protein
MRQPTATARGVVLPITGGEETAEREWPRDYFLPLALVVIAAFLLVYGFSGGR